MRPGLAGPQIRDPLGLGLREGAHGDTELAPSFTRPPPPNPARSSASEPASTGVCVCVRVPLRPPQGSAPRSQPTLNFSPGKPGKLKGAVAVRVGVCVGGGGQAMRDSAPRTAPSLTYHRSGTAGRPEAGHGIGTEAARAAPPCPGRSLLRLAASRSKSPRPTFPSQGWLSTHGSAPSPPASSPDARGPPPAASGPPRPPWGGGTSTCRGRGRGRG